MYTDYTFQLKHTQFLAQRLKLYYLVMSKGLWSKLRNKYHLHFAEKSGNVLAKALNCATTVVSVTSLYAPG